MARVPVIWELGVVQSMPPLTLHLSPSCFPCTQLQQMSEQQSDSGNPFLMPLCYLPRTKQLSCRSNSEKHLPKCILKAFLNVFLLWEILGDNLTRELKLTLSWKLKKCYWKGAWSSLHPDPGEHTVWEVCKKMNLTIAVEKHPHFTGDFCSERTE